MPSFDLDSNFLLPREVCETLAVAPIHQDVPSTVFAGQALDGLCGAQGSIEKCSPVPFDHAGSYVIKVKNRFCAQPEIYEQFLEVLQSFKREGKPAQYVYAQVTKLFEAAPDLLEEFKQFLPESAAHSDATAQKQLVGVDADNNDDLVCCICREAPSVWDVLVKTITCNHIMGVDCLRRTISTRLRLRWLEPFRCPLCGADISTADTWTLCREDDNVELPQDEPVVTSIVDPTQSIPRLSATNLHAEPNAVTIDIVSRRDFNQLLEGRHVRAFHQQPEFIRQFLHPIRYARVLECLSGHLEWLNNAQLEYILNVLIAYPHAWNDYTSFFRILDSYIDATECAVYLPASEVDFQWRLIRWLVGVNGAGTPDLPTHRPNGRRIEYPPYPLLRSFDALYEG